MLPSLHSAIKQMIYFRGRISPREVDVEFHPPTRAYLDRLTRPTINLFLYDVSENTELRRNEFRTTRSNGQSERRMALMSIPGACTDMRIRHHTHANDPLRIGRPSAVRGAWADTDSPARRD